MTVSFGRKPVSEPVSARGNGPLTAVCDSVIAGTFARHTLPGLLVVPEKALHVSSSVNAVPTSARAGRDARRARDASCRLLVPMSSLFGVTHADLRDQRQRIVNSGNQYY
ncbi:hypothetical protein Sya03_58320 [Spirilliplanes yamanashiensis]|uniref:Uncharacterized protein n=1 Tax=Spirilliplanes yamanashiensis TaxID=42233 RepID=A0A8J4DMS5_9ACTN|nr:hypothetical protein Sya03_58320 [Spirilliplanes yamanashiensis]